MHGHMNVKQRDVFYRNNVSIFFMEKGISQLVATGNISQIRRIC